MARRATVTGTDHLKFQKIGPGPFVSSNSESIRRSLASTRVCDGPPGYGHGHGSSQVSENRPGALCILEFRVNTTVTGFDSESCV
jgi:hypothetical protein